MSYPYQILSEEAYIEAYTKSIQNPEIFWADIAQYFVWKKPWDKVLTWNFKEPNIKWFEGGKLNITENCLDRHLLSLGDKIAIIWEPNDPNELCRSYTYKELHYKVVQFAQVLRNNGIVKGDRVCIYMGMIPELAIAMLACARIGAIHSVIFGGFSAQSIADRVNDTQAKLIITCDGAYRANKIVALKNIVDDALTRNCRIDKVIVYQRTNTEVSMLQGRDVWWHLEIEQLTLNNDLIYEATAVDAEDPLYILYTSGSTGKPKGVVHTTAGYMIYTTYTFVNVFQYQPSDIYFCTADIGWVTGHSYLVYAPLCVGATSVLFEGTPTWPDAGRLWDIVAKHKVSILYTAPTAIRSLMSFGDTFTKGKNFDTLRVLGSVGEPINEEAWHWYNEKIGNKKCPIVDTWWQTETGGIMISNLAGITPSKPSFATLPLPGIQPVLMNEEGVEIKEEETNGKLCIKFPWPGMIRTTYGDHERCRLNYFSAFDNLYFTGDGCFFDEKGYYRITGRVDDVINISGHRVGTAEIENAINSAISIIESAVVAYPHDIKGQAIYAYVILNDADIAFDQIRNEIFEAITNQIGAFAKPDKIQIVRGLPKTRSGKIMRRILRKIAEGEIHNIGDTTSLLDADIVTEIISSRVL